MGYLAHIKKNNEKRECQVSLNWLRKSKFSVGLMLLSQTLTKAFHKHPDIFWES